MTVRRLVMWRHGETDHNVAGRFQGHFDSKLTEVGLNQARFAVPALARFEPGLIVSSDLRRAADTAGVLADATGIPMRVDKRLRETLLGQWQGLTIAEVEQGWPGELARWRGGATHSPPGGESRIEVAARAWELVTELLESEDDTLETVLLASHGGLISTLTGRLLGLPPEHWKVFRSLDNCHWVELVHHYGIWRVYAYNAGMTG